MVPRSAFLLLVCGVESFNVCEVRSGVEGTVGHNGSTKLKCLTSVVFLYDNAHYACTPIEVKVRYICQQIQRFTVLWAYQNGDVGVVELVCFYFISVDLS